jgi:branched-chain amino acid aminotransferase
MYQDLAGVIPHPFLYIADFPLRYTVAGFSKYFTEGVHCVTSKVQQVPDACIPSSAKHRSRLHFHLAQMQAPAGTWPLMRRGGDLHYCEAPGANIVYVRQGQVTAVTDSALPGISLQTVQQLTRSPIGSLYPDMRMDELWLTGTPFCMLPVVSLDGKPIGTGKPGPRFQQTLAKWSELVGVNIQQQIETWDQT